LIKTEKLNISSEIRASAIEGIHDPEMWLKEESDQRSNLVVGRNKPGNYNGRTTHGRTHWSFHEDNDAARTISDIIFSTIICNKQEWTTDQVWGAAYNKGDYAQTHTHGKNRISWVYYLSCCNNCAPLLLEEAESEEASAHYDHLYDEKALMGYTRNLCHAKEIIPETNLLVYFNSEVVHEVPEQKCNHERIILAGNVSKDSKMMTWEEAY